MAKQIDRLAMDVAMATKAGMSYGMWKALHPRTDVPQEPEPDERYVRICAHCGKEFVLHDRRVKKYCTDECRCKAWEKTKWERMRAMEGNK